MKLQLEGSEQAFGGTLTRRGDTVFGKLKSKLHKNISLSRNWMSVFRPQVTDFI